ncbi:MAG: ParB/RepB/Spo0J family partition protein [Thermodesulfobacteriota bacterium]
MSFIDFNDHTFLVGYKQEIQSLADSIKGIGLLNPPILRQKAEKYQIITGWKRLFACQDLGFDAVSCSVYETTDLEDDDSLRIIYSDNEYRLSDLEIAELIGLHKSLCELDDNEIISNVLPIYNIPPNRKHLDKYLAMSSLENDIKTAFYQDKITIEQCLMLSELNSESRTNILEKILLKYKLNNNESRQVIQHISELALIYSKSILELLSTVHDEYNNNKIDKNDLRTELKKMRYPDLVRTEQQVKEKIQDLQLPDNIKVLINGYFEENEIEFRIRVNSGSEITELITDLETINQNGTLDSLISTIRKGIT